MVFGLFLFLWLYSTSTLSPRRTAQPSVHTHGHVCSPANFAMCGRSSSPNFFFTWPGSRVALDMTDTGDAANQDIPRSMFATARLWDDGVRFVFEYESDDVTSNVTTPTYDFFHFLCLDGATRTRKVLRREETRQTLVAALDSCRHRLVTDNKSRYGVMRV